MQIPTMSSEQQQRIDRAKNSYEKIMAECSKKGVNYEDLEEYRTAKQKYFDTCSEVLSELFE